MLDSSEITDFKRELLDAALPALEADRAWRQMIEQRLRGIEARLTRIEDGYGIGDDAICPVG